MPVDRPLRLFEPDWIESLTKTPWWVVPAFWIPTICYICRTGVLDAAGKSSVVSYMGEQGLVLLFCYFIWIKMSEVKLFIFKKAVMLLSFAAGLLLWTVIEYCLHRWVFHFNPEGGGPYTCALHFLIHGLHHKVSKSYMIFIRQFFEYDKSLTYYALQIKIHIPKWTCLYEAVN